MQKHADSHRRVTATIPGGKSLSEFRLPKQFRSHYQMLSTGQPLITVCTIGDLAYAVDIAVMLPDSLGYHHEHLNCHVSIVEQDAGSSADPADALIVTIDCANADPQPGGTYTLFAGRYIHSGSKIELATACFSLHNDTPHAQTTAKVIAGFVPKPFSNAIVLTPTHNLSPVITDDILPPAVSYDGKFINLVLLLPYVGDKPQSPQMSLLEPSEEIDGSKVLPVLIHNIEDVRASTWTLFLTSFEINEPIMAVHACLEFNRDAASKPGPRGTFVAVLRPDDPPPPIAG